jgi:hypothetical protein
VPFILPNQERIERRGEKERRQIESDKVGRRWRMKKQEEREANGVKPPRLILFHPQ